MLISKPDYYEEFHCIADRCEATCCAGWQIVIDEDSLERYRQESGDFSWELKRRINWKEGVFRQDRARRCAFLNADNLCDLYTALGEESLCRTCTDYPRHIEEFENVREYTLSVSCPEAARILLQKKEPFSFVETEEAGEEAFEDFDFLLYSQLTDARAVMLKILQNRELDIGLRAYLVWELGQEMQEYMDEERLFDCEEIFAKYEAPETWAAMEKQLKPRYETSLGFYRNLYELEFLHEDWEEHLEETAAILYVDGREAYDKLETDFQKWLEEYMPDYQIWLEQLLVYFVQTYFCGAVYDGYIASKIRMAVSSVWLIYEMLAARWKQNGRELDMEDVVLMVYRYSRELEHSDLNLETMEDLSGLL